MFKGKESNLWCHHDSITTVSPGDVDVHEMQALWHFQVIWFGDVPVYCGKKTSLGYDYILKPWDVPFPNLTREHQLSSLP